MNFEDARNCAIGVAVGVAFYGCLVVRSPALLERPNPAPAAPAAALSPCRSLPAAANAPCPPGSGLTLCFDKAGAAALTTRLTVLHEAALGDCRYE